LFAVELAVGVVVEAVPVRVLAGEDCGPAGPADGVRDEAAIEPHAFFRDAVEAGRFEQLPVVAVTAHCLGGEVIGEDEEDVGLLRRGLGGGGLEGREGDEEEGEREADHGGTSGCKAGSGLVIVTRAVPFVSRTKALIASRSRGFLSGANPPTSVLADRD